MYTGPKLTNKDLVFGYDTGYGIANNSIATRFYPGEPTTNLLPSPGTNGRFTTSNGWSTYNTNQYNGNNDFSIGVVGSVTNNIVTLSSVGTTIRSFDVLNPATTGGGVTAGTNYVIKKISSTTFSLHAYNSSQDGSQGYTNSSTGFFKVHDAYANDTRVSITASSFPTMWHGSPHLPNSGLIKEIVPNGGRIPGTPSMRHHVYRGDNVADGMAYGVYTPVTAGDVINVSFWVRGTSSAAFGRGLTYSTYFGAGNGVYGSSRTIDSNGDWSLHNHTWTASVSTSFYSYFFPAGYSEPYAYDIADLQIEVNTGGHATPFTLTSRSDTQCLIDLVKTTDIDVSNVSFDSTGQPEFDGTDDKGVITNFPHIWNSSLSVESVVSWDDDTRSVILGNYDQGSGGHDINFEKNPSGTLRFYWDRGSRDVYSSANAVTTAGAYHHVVFVRDVSANNFRFYVDGELVTTVANAGSNIPTTGSTFRFGADTRNGSTVHNGSIPVIKAYSRVLTAAEITSNYNAYKNRFNI
jgi:hypothetical protein